MKKRWWQVLITREYGKDPETKEMRIARDSVDVFATLTDAYAKGWRQVLQMNPKPYGNIEPRRTQQILVSI